MSAAKTEAQSIIDQYPVAVFSKSYCPYCTETKRLLSSMKGLNKDNYQVIELDQRPDGSAIQDALREMGRNQRTVPNIWIAKNNIGGNSDLQSLSSGDQLEGLIQDAIAA